MPDEVRDVDVAFFDPDDLSRANDDGVTERRRQPTAAPYTERRSRPGVQQRTRQVVRGSRHDSERSAPELITGYTISRWLLRKTAA